MLIPTIFRNISNIRYRIPHTRQKYNRVIISAGLVLSTKVHKHYNVKRSKPEYDSCAVEAGAAALCI